MTVTELENKLQYSFRNRELLLTALTHSSYSNENRGRGTECYERLEFLGDSILGFVTAKYLYSLEPTMPEGKMTRLRAELVCEQSLHTVAQELGLGGFMRMGRGEDKNGGRQRPSILADTVESVIAAMYLDGGMEVAEGFIRRTVLSPASIALHRTEDYKTELQELVQRRSGQLLEYFQAGEHGPDHAKIFEVGVRLNGADIGFGRGRTKKEAEQAAACEALKRLRK